MAGPRAGMVMVGPCAGNRASYHAALFAISVKRRARRAHPACRYVGCLTDDLAEQRALLRVRGDAQPARAGDDLPRTRLPRQLSPAKVRQVRAAVQLAPA